MSRNTYDSSRIDFAATTSFNAVIAGSNILLTSTAISSANAVHSDLTNKLVAFSVNLIGGADTLIQNVSINGEPAKVDVQCNTGGFISAIISIVSPVTPSDRVYRAVLTVSGTVVSAGRGSIFIQGGMALRSPAAVASSTTAIATARTVALPLYVNGLLICTAINDVSASNQCTWTGTNNPPEDDDANLGTARGSAAHRTANITESQSYSVTATFDVISVNGMSLAVASYR